MWVESGTSEGLPRESWDENIISEKRCIYLSHVSLFHRFLSLHLITPSFFIRPFGESILTLLLRPSRTLQNKLGSSQSNVRPVGGQACCRPWSSAHIQRTHVLGVRGVVLLESSEGRFLWILPSMGYISIWGIFPNASYR